MLREFSGNAKTTSLTGAISASATSIPVADATGYPTGAVGPFVITIDAGLAAEEKVLCVSRTGNTLTVQNRGWDGTTASDHGNAAKVQHTYSATDAREANAHVNATGPDDDPHPQYLTATEADALFLTPTEGDTLFLSPAEGDEAYIKRSQVQSASVASGQTTTSATYADLATVGPAVTATIGTSGTALVILTAQVSNNTAGQFALMSYAVSGATTAAAQEDSVVTFRSDAAGQFSEHSITHFRSGLTPGDNTFTAKYRVSAGAGTFLRRHITVIPL